MTEPLTGADAASAPSDADGIEHAVEDERTQRRRLVGVWMGAGSAVAAMAAVSWYVVVARGGSAPHGDMIGHAATAEWLRTLPWWDWRGWSDWFYGGQAIGVNYPPLGHAWMRFTHPVHGQMAAVALGLLVLLPWGALRLARAVGCTPRAQRAAVAAALVLTAASANMHIALPGFHQEHTFFSSWPTMLATAVGLHTSAWAARCRRPEACGVVAGVSLLLNATVAPGVAVVCVTLLATSGASFRQAVRWAITAGAAALVVSAWWLVPFLAGSARLVRWEEPLSFTWGALGLWQVAVLTFVGVAAAWAARRGTASSRRLAAAAGAGLLATISADLFGYLRAERWLTLPLLVAVLAASGLVASASRRDSLRPVRPAWAVLIVASLIVFVVISLRLEVLPLAAWLLWRPQRTWAWSSALAWAAVLLWIPLWGQIRTPVPSEPLPAIFFEAASAQDGPGTEGLIYSKPLHTTASGNSSACGAWRHPWQITLATEGDIRPLRGLYRETSASAEFIRAELNLREGVHQGLGQRRPHWFDAWQDAGILPVDNPARAEALGARWYAACNSDGDVAVTELPGTMAIGVTVNPLPDEDAWHRAAVEWWIASFQRSPESKVVPVLFPTRGYGSDHPIDQAAAGVSLHSGQDSLTVRAEEAGWAWLRVPWDPDWRSVGETPVYKGGPGHLVVWAERGVTEFRWSISGAVDAAAAAVTGVAALAVVTLAVINRRRDWQIDANRHKPAADALLVFADTVDGWAEATAQHIRRMTDRARRWRPRSGPKQGP